MKSQKSYTTTQVADMLGLTVRQLDYWANQEIVVPSVQRSTGRGSPKRYALEDLVQLHFIAQLKRHGWSTQRIRAAIVHLREVIEDPYPLRTAVLFDGKGTMLALCKTKDGERILLDMDKSCGQQVMWVIVEILVEDLRKVTSQFQPDDVGVMEVTSCG